MTGPTISPPAAPVNSLDKPARELSLFDSTNLIVGIIIGAGIYQMAPDIAKGAGSAWMLLGLWVLGGLLSLCGALSYAELATAYPQAGGDYVYLSRAYGKWAGFLFGWAQMAIVRPGDIAVMAFAFATYARTLWDPLSGTSFQNTEPLYAVLAVAVLTGINVLGVRQGKWTQNLLTVAKALGLLLIVAAAFLGKPGTSLAPPSGGLPLSLALIFVLFTFGGWNEMAYVAAEVRNPQKNIVRALVLGIAAVTVLYLLVNIGFLRGLGFAGLTQSKAVATDTLAAVWPNSAALFISVLVCVSALGAVNGLVFTGARITYAMGSDHRLFSKVGRWDPRLGTPAAALLLQGVIACGLILALGSFVHAVLYTAATVYSFYLATTVAVMVLRWKEPAVARPYRVPAYPLVPIIFAAACVFLIHSSVTYKPLLALLPIGILLLGIPLWFLSSRKGKQSESVNK